MRNNRTGRKTPSLALGICEFHQSYFYTNYTLLINRKLVSGEVRKLLLSVVKIEFNSRYYNILIALFAMRQLRLDLLTSSTID